MCRLPVERPRTLCFCSSPGRGKKLLCPPYRRECLCCLTSLLFNGTGGSFTRFKAVWTWSSLDLVPRLRISGAVHSPWAFIGNLRVHTSTGQSQPLICMKEPNLALSVFSEELNINTLLCDIKHEHNWDLKFFLYISIKRNGGKSNSHFSCSFYCRARQFTGCSILKSN